MPDHDGFGVMEKFADCNKDLPPPVLVLTAQTDANVRQKALNGGARDFLLKPFVGEEVVSRVYNLLDMHLLQKIIQNNNTSLETEIQKRTQYLINTQREIVQRLRYAAEYRDNETADHTIRVGEYSKILAEELGFTGETLRNLHHAAPLHDIAKIGIADATLLKPGKFSPEERKEMETHTSIGGEILKGETSCLLKIAREVAIAHHERWDGTGYPLGLAGKSIPLVARIVSVADVFDTLTTTRPYKKAWSIEKAVAFIEENSASMFDPQVVMAFKKRITQLLKIQQQSFDPDQIKNDN